MIVAKLVPALGLAALAGSSWAQEAPTPADPRTRAEIAEFSKCLVRHRPEDSRRAVLEDWDSRKLVYRELLKEPMCSRLGRTLRFNSGVLQGSLASHLIGSDLEAEDIARVTTAPPLIHPVPEPVATTDSRGRPLAAAEIARRQETMQRRLSWVVIGQLGECVARTNAAAVPALAASPVASEEELGALKAFGAQLPACLPKGVTLELDRSSLRGAIVTGYYRLAMAARPAQVQGAAR